MTQDSTRHFDAPRTGSVTGPATSVMRGHWKSIVALAVSVSILQAMAFGLVGVDAIGSDRIAASVASFSIFVAAETDASAAEVDALGPLIRAVPGISTATLRPKDDAIKTLIASGLPTPDGRNPLPDVWAVRLQSDAFGSSRSLAAEWTEKRQALAALPRVASVSTDERWVATIDRGIARWRAHWPKAWSIGLGVLAVACACAAFLAGRSLSVPSEPGSTRQVVGMQVLAIAAFLVVLVITPVSYLASWAAIGWTSVVATGHDLGSFDQWTAARPLFTGSIVIATMLLIAGGLAVGRQSHE